MRRIVIWAFSALVVASVLQGQVVISEFRVRGPNGAADEFVELYNNSDVAVDISGWKIRGSNSGGTVGTRLTIAAGTAIPARGHFLATNSSTSGGPYSGPVPGDATYATGITDTGGIAVTLPDDTVVDQVGMSLGSAFKEGTPLANLGTSNQNRSYERRPGGADGSTQDTNDNATDFVLISPSDPQNLGSAPTPGTGPPSLSINDVSVLEGHSGTVTATFVVSLSSPAPFGGVSFDIATQDGSAMVADNDYVAKVLTGQTIDELSTVYTFDVTVNGDTVFEPNETFFVNVTNVTGATVADGQGVGTILNDDPGPVVISEFRVRGPVGGNDEFIELYNNSDVPVDIGSWRIKGSNSSGVNSVRLTITAGTTLPARRHFLATNAASSGYSGSVPGDQTYTTGITDDGGIAITLPDDTIVDQVGMSAGSAFKEGTPLASLGSSNLNRGYERLPGGAAGSTQDTDDNASDFVVISPSAPQNLSSTPTPGSTGPTGAAAANPSTVDAGDPTLLTVAVTPGTNPPSSGITVSGNLSSLGGAAAQTLYDDGTNGDVIASDNVFSYLAPVPSDTALGNKTLTFTVTDTEGRFANPSTVLTVAPTSLVYEIFEIQGSGNESPLAGQRVKTVDNVVTAVGTQGFFIQTPDFRADASTATSNGIYVFTGSPASVQVGNEVDVVGTVIEFFGMTEFSGGVGYRVNTPSVLLPAHFEIPVGFTDFETIEGMLVRVTDGVAAAGTDQFNETMIVAGADRPFRRPGVDGGSQPQIFEVDPSWGVTPRPPSPGIVGGATITLAEGPMIFTFNDYVIWTTTLSFTNPPLPRPVRERNAGEMTVGAQNMFRLFEDNSGRARLGAFSNHIRTVLGAPDVLAVSETGNVAILEELAARIQADDSTIAYTAYLLEGNDVGGIDVGFLVRDSVRVDMVQQLGAADTWADPISIEPRLLNDRPPLLLQGAYLNNGSPFPIAVIAVHQRSLIGIETDDRVRAKRREQATRLAGYIQLLQDSSPGIRIVVTGDFNAFEFDDGYVDVMGIVTSTPDPDLTNHVLGVPAADRYSYLHEGSAQVLDHSLTSDALNRFVRGLQFTRSNADAPVSLSRVSDHDGLVLYVITDEDADGVPDDLDHCLAGDVQPTVVLGSCDSRAPNVVFDEGCTIIDRLKAIAAAARHRGELVAQANAMLNEAVKDGKLTGGEKGAIESCVARWNP